MTEEKKVEIGNQILGKDDIIGSFSKDGDVFKYQVPNPREKREIEQLISRKVGVPLENYNRDTLILVRACTYLDNTLIQTPKWWTSAEECYDEELLLELFTSYIEFENSFRGKLKRGGFKGNSEKP